MGHGLPQMMVALDMMIHQKTIPIFAFSGDRHSPEARALLSAVHGEFVAARAIVHCDDALAVPVDRSQQSGGGGGVRVLIDDNVVLSTSDPDQLQQWIASTL